MAAPTPAQIATDARWLAQAYDGQAGLVRIVAMDAEAYRAASFLDDRLLHSPHEAHVLPFATVAAALPADARRDARWIFHIGHVGSTLVARLLGELPGVLALREPRLLRDLAGVDRVPLVGSVQALLSRTFDPEARALVKATSLCSDFAADLVPADGRALFLTASPANYCGTILAGENSRRELAMLAPSRTERMADRVPALTEAGRSDAHLAAAAWACEATALEAAADQLGQDVVLWADFDRVLSDVPAALSRMAAHFGFSASSAQLDAIGGGPLMRRYSKAMEYDYSPALRSELIAEALAENRSAVADAMAMLDRAAVQSPYLARALARAKER